MRVGDCGGRGDVAENGASGDGGGPLRRRARESAWVFWGAEWRSASVPDVFCCA